MRLRPAPLFVLTCLLTFHATIACRPTATTATTGMHGTPPPRYTFVDAMPEFWRVLDDTRGRDDREWLTAFRARIVERHRVVYGLSRGGLDDSSLVAFRRHSLTHESELRALADSIPAKLATLWGTFARALPDLESGAVLYVLPAPPQAIGGWYRPLPQHDAVVLGFSALAGLRTDAELSMLVQHELMHLYHAQVNAQMRAAIASFFMNHGDHRTTLGELIWLEGLATYAAREVTPDALPNGLMDPRTVRINEATRAKTAAVFRAQLDASDSTTLGALVFGATDAVPPGAAYYIGLKVAERLGRGRTLAELARLQGPTLREQVAAELRQMEMAPPPR